MLARRGGRGRSKPWCVGGSTGSSILSRSQADLDAEMAIAQSVGMRYIRFDFDWSYIEGTQGSPQWVETDRVVASVIAHGMQVLGILTHAPPWANGSSNQKYFPTNMTQWGAFCTMVANRYKNTVRHWEIWNEPNGGQSPDANPPLYASVLQTAYQAVKAVDSGFLVIGPATSPAVQNPPADVDPRVYIDYLYDNGYNQYLDAVSCHCYTWPLLPNTVADWNSFYQVLNDVRARMVAGGDSAKKIWITECGAPTGTAANAVTQEQQAQAIDIYLGESKARGFVACTFIYSVRDRGTTLTDTEHNFGIALNNFTNKLSYATVDSYT